jgi:hypothetical protein
MKLSVSILAFVPVAVATLRAEDPTVFEVGAFKFSRPADWPWVPVASPMRKAQLTVPGKDGAQSAEIAFFHFGPGGAGGVDANVKRWLGQFKSQEGVAKVETKDVGLTKVTFVSTEGTFSSGMPGGTSVPSDGYALLGAILDHPGGPVFVKMTGPIAVVQAARTQFTEFVSAAARGK